jgi:hypothetical protein
MQGAVVLMLGMGWQALIASLKAQNRVDWLHAMPGLARTLRNTVLLAAPWIGVLAWYLLTLMELPLNAAPLALLVAIALAAFAWITALPVLGVIPAFLPTAYLWATRQAGAAAGSNLDSLDALSCAALCLLCWASLAPLFGTKSIARLQQRWRMQSLLDQVLRQERVPKASLRVAMSSSQGLGDRLVGWLLRRVLRRPSAQSAMPRLSTVLFWRMGLWPRLGLGMLGIWLGLSAFFLLWHLGGRHFESRMVGLFGALITHCGILAALYFSPLPALRQEQKLLLLLPGVPRGTSLSQAWAKESLRRAFWVWAVCGAINLVFILIWRGAEPLHALSLQALSLPFLLLALRRPASLNSGSQLGFVSLMVLSVAIASVAYAEPHWAYQLAITSVLLALPVGGWMWRRLQSSPEPFPAGRLARAATP